MAYEKFIKKDGKTYGPYVYHSKRIDGKVVSEYHGQRKEDYRKFLVIGLGVLILGIFLYFIAFSEKNITGNSVLDLNANYQKGQTLEGNLKLSLQEGELIPASSQLFVENDGKIYEFNLKDVISEEPTEGNFYVNGASVSGFGEGYGIPGEKEVFPDVYFTLSVLSKQESDVSSEENGDAGTQETTEVSNEENTTSIADESQSSEFEESIQETTEVPDEENTESIPEEPSLSESEETTGDTTSEDSRSGILDVVATFFLGLTPTGFAVVETESEIQGKVSSGQEFRYTLLDGQRVELKPRSVKTDSKQLNDDDVEIKVVGNEVIVKTTYSEKEEGFGQEYLDSEEKEFLIDISELGLNLEEGDLTLKVVDSGQEIMLLTTPLEEGSLNVEKETTIDSLGNSSIGLGVNTETNNSFILKPTSAELTSEEKTVLEKEFGNFSVETKEAVLKNGFVTVRYELGNYWVEHSYEADLSNDTLKALISQDKDKWLKDVAKTLMNEKTVEQTFNLS